MIDIVHCEGCPCVAMCRIKRYNTLLKDCSLIRTMVDYTSQIRTSLMKVEEILDPTSWELKVSRDGAGRITATVLEKSDARYVKIEAEYDLTEYASYPVTGKSAK